MIRPCGRDRRACGHPCRRWVSGHPATGRLTRPPDNDCRNIFALAAPYQSAGVVLSQPHSSTTASIGFARNGFLSTSIAIRLRNMSADEHLAKRNALAIRAEKSGRPNSASQFGNRAKVHVAVVQLTPGIANSDDRLTIRKKKASAASHARRERAVESVRFPPLLASKLTIFAGHQESLDHAPAVRADPLVHARRLKHGLLLRLRSTLQFLQAACPWFCRKNAAVMK